jgi:plastocyanin
MTKVGWGFRAVVLLVAVAAAAGITATLAQGDDPPSTAAFRTVDGPNVFQLTAGSGTSTSASIVTGGSVTFSNASVEMHDVDFSTPPQGGLSCQQTAGGSAPTALRFPDSPTAGTWAGTCTFTRAGTYSFACDEHPGMTGTVVVSDPGTTTVATTTAPTVTTPPPVTTVPAGAPPTTTPTTTTPSTPALPVDGSPAAVVRALAVRVGLAQRGIRLRGTISGARGTARVKVALTARRGDLGLAGRSATQSSVGTLSALTSRSGTLTFTIGLGATARAALARAHRLAITVLISAPLASGRTAQRTFRVVVRPAG